MATTRVLSREDGKLNQSTLITSRKKDYSDIDLSFTAKPNGELYLKKDAAAVKQSIKNLILTNYFEKPFTPFFGGNVSALLFELADDDIDIEVEDSIINAIETYEPRARIINIDVIAEPERNTIKVTLEFQVINSEEIITFTTSLSRLR
jgi:phage baseplate assembly protein W